MKKKKCSLHLYKKHVLNSFSTCSKLAHKFYQSCFPTPSFSHQNYRNTTSIIKKHGHNTKSVCIYIYIYICIHCILCIRANQLSYQVMSSTHTQSQLYTFTPISSFVQCHISFWLLPSSVATFF